MKVQGAQLTGRRITLGALKYYGGAKNPNNVTRTFCNSVHCFRKTSLFENGGAKLASCPGRHLTLRPCQFGD